MSAHCRHRDVAVHAPPEFSGGVGNTRGDKADFESLINDVTTKLFDRYPDDTVLHPGHGKDSTLGAERPSLPQWRARGW